METLMQVLPIIVYVVLIILIIVLIVLGIKCIKVINKADAILTDAQAKLDKLKSFFSVFDTISAYATLLSNKIVKAVKKIITKLVNREDKNKQIEEEELESILREEGDYNE